MKITGRNTGNGWRRSGLRYVRKGINSTGRPRKGWKWSLNTSNGISPKTMKNINVILTGQCMCNATVHMFVSWYCKHSSATVLHVTVLCSVQRLTRYAQYGRGATCVWYGVLWAEGGWYNVWGKADIHCGQAHRDATAVTIKMLQKASRDFLSN